MSNLMVRLYELVAALDRRTPRPERADEDQIARDAAELKKQALDKIAEIS